MGGQITFECCPMDTKTGRVWKAMKTVPVRYVWPGQLKMSEGVTACIVLASAGGLDGVLLYCQAGLAVIVATFAR
jgi:hypothetical protein